MHFDDRSLVALVSVWDAMMNDDTPTRKMFLAHLTFNWVYMIVWSGLLYALATSSQELGSLFTLVLLALVFVGVPDYRMLFISYKRYVKQFKERQGRKGEE